MLNRDLIKRPSFQSQPSTDRLLWGVAILTFGIGDVITTAMFISLEMNHEGNPLVANVIETVGLWILLPWKLVVFGIFGLLYRATPDSISVGVPLGLSVFGAILTVWNIYSSVFGARLGL